MAEDEVLIKKLERRLKKLQALEARLVELLKEIVNDEIIDEIKRKMFAANYSIRIIDNVELRNIKLEGTKLKYEIRNELLVGEGFDIAVGMEEGTRPHDIFGNPILAFPVKAVFPQFTKVTGSAEVTAFATKVHHPGIEAKHIIHDTVLEKSSQVQARYEDEVKTQIKLI